RRHIEERRRRAAPRGAHALGRPFDARDRAPDLIVAEDPPGSREETIGAGPRRRSRMDDRARARLGHVEAVAVRAPRDELAARLERHVGHLVRARDGRRALEALELLAPESVRLLAPVGQARGVLEGLAAP